MSETIWNLNAGMSTCPVCERSWLVTPANDCLLPACGCFGSDTSEKNPRRPCEACGLKHSAAHFQAEQAVATQAAHAEVGEKAGELSGPEGNSRA